ncbi:hypothetical protein [Microbacterium sp. C7(2022)]|uniref:hypothetical protein n=1 Tax=Microbacterium sp. C7(2022) TaxID=2992759 RepID=UPI00237C3769|nr:hypothetical protein [Microbacterium sp. C7(2022)]MDE0547485.1 hypothetical protein [Microbacterium sp. C7(2022)]
MTDFSALGFDPAPGDVGVLDGYVDSLTAGCDGVDDALAMFDGDDDAAWVGQSATAFRATMSEDFRPHLADTGEALRTSRNALRTWSTQLAGYQQRAATLAERAQAATTRISSCESSHAAALRHRDDEDADPDAVSNAFAALNSAQGELEDIRGEARLLKLEVDDDASAAAHALNDAGSILADYKGNRFSNFLSDIGSGLADFGNWMMDNVVPILEDILRAALPIIAILSIFIPALGPIALGISIALVAIDGLQALTGRGSWQEFAVGAVGLAAGGLLGVAAKTLIGPGGQVLLPTIQGMTPAMAGGGGAAAGSLTVALNVNMQNMVANTYWMTNTAKGAVDDSQSFIESLGGPWENLRERVTNTVRGDGPKTDEELRA